MDGRKDDGWMKEWTDGCMDVWMEGRMIEEWMDDRWMDGRTDGWTNR